MSLLTFFQHRISRVMGWLANNENRWLSQTLITIVQKRFQITLEEAEQQEFTSLNAFFTRKLKPSARPLAPAPAILCPVDGTISGLGIVDSESIITVKEHDYTLTSLFGHHHELAKPFEEGLFASYYLAPHNYHRVHCPLDAELIHTLAVPGSLYTVDHNRSSMPKDVFARNERVIALFQVEGGHMAVIFVGATMVGSIHSVWSGQITPPMGPWVDRHDFLPQQQPFHRGDELGHFQFGSSVIVLLSPGIANQWHSQLPVDSLCQMGTTIGTTKEPT